MQWLMVIFMAAIFVELLFRLPVSTVFGNLQFLALKIERLLRSQRISDHWKERVLLRYAADLAVDSVRLLLMLSLALLPVAILAALCEMLGVPAWTLLGSVTGLVVCTLAGVGYGILRSRLFHAPRGR